MPIIEYDLREQPHASGEKAAGYYPVAVSHNKADERKPQNEDNLKWENVHADKY